MIDCKKKDKVLNKIVKESPEMTFAFDVEDSKGIFGFDPEMVSSILDYFESIGLIDQDKFLGGEIIVEILIPAHDLVARGGFTAKEELLIKNLEKLLSEVESLKPSMPEKVESITSMVSDISAGLALIRQRKQ
jgi:hypothetical protein